ncbi:MAG: hypothetical protein CL627_09885 [Aurantimonas sp.]|nr:hypothetical protein [Aurantimonas sp.]
MHPFLRAIPYPVRPISARQGGFARRGVAACAARGVNAANDAAEMQIGGMVGSGKDLAWVLGSSPRMTTLLKVFATLRPLWTFPALRPLQRLRTS